MLRLSDEADVAQAELEQHLEAQAVAATASVGEPPAGFRRGYGEDAVGFAQKVARGVEISTEAILEIAESIQKMKDRLNRKEFAAFVRDMLHWLGADARKYLDVARVFEGFDPSQLSGLEPFTLFKLRAKKYAPVVERLREEASISSLRVQELIKELLPKSPKKQKQSVDIGWVSDSKGGGRHFRINLYDEATGMTILEATEERKITGQKFLANAVAHYTSNEKPTETQQPYSEYRLAQLEELPVVVAHARNLEAENRAIKNQNEKLERELEEVKIESDRRIADLEARLAQVLTLQQPDQSKFASVPEVVVEPEPESESKSEPELEKRIEPVIGSESDWLEPEQESDEIEFDNIFAYQEFRQLSLPEVQPDFPFTVGDEVQIITEKKGASLLGKTGIITAIGTKGATVKVFGRLVWFEEDEIEEVPF